MSEKKLPSRLWLTALLLIFVLVSCQLNNASQTKPTGTQTDRTLMKGVILYVERYKNDKNVIDFGEIVEGGKRISNVGRVSFADDCEFLFSINGQEEEASSDDLAVGQTAEIYVTEILESYPWQSTISKIVITSPDPQVSLKPVSTFLDPEFEGVIISIVNPEANLPAKLVIAVNSAPNYQGVQEASLDLRDQVLIWQKTDFGYRFISLEDLSIGQKVSVDLYDKNRVDLSPFSELAFEIIVLSNEN